MTYRHPGSEGSSFSASQAFLFSNNVVTIFHCVRVRLAHPTSDTSYVGEDSQESAHNLIQGYDILQQKGTKKNQQGEKLMG